MVNEKVNIFLLAGFFIIFMLIVVMTAPRANAEPPRELPEPIPEPTALVRMWYLGHAGIGAPVYFFRHNGHDCYAMDGGQGAAIACSFSTSGN